MLGPLARPRLTGNIGLVRIWATPNSTVTVFNAAPELINVWHTGTGHGDISNRRHQAPWYPSQRPNNPAIST
jgi:hypothetical protein